jgi:hypothetical protein
LTAELLAMEKLSDRRATAEIAMEGGFQDEVTAKA